MEGILLWLESMVLASGAWAPIFYVLLIIIGIAFSPIPTTPLMIFSGHVFGFVDGLFWSMIGVVFGTLIAFFIGRLLGRRILQYFVSDENIKKVEEKLSEEHLTLSIFVLHLLPLPFLDVVSFVAGLTRIKVKYFILAVFFGYLPSVSLFVFFGETTDNFLLSLLLIVGAVVLFTLFYEAYSFRKHSSGFIGRRSRIFFKK